MQVPHLQIRRCKMFAHRSALRPGFAKNKNFFCFLFFYQDPDQLPLVIITVSQNHLLGYLAMAFFERINFDRDRIA